MAENARSKLPAPTEQARQDQIARVAAVYGALIGVAVTVCVLWRPQVPAAMVIGSAAVLALPVIGWIVYVVRLRRRMQRFLVENVQGVAALGRGELQAAHDLFWRWAEDARATRASAVARHNLGWTLMRQGELQHAIDVLQDNDARNGEALKAVGLAATTAIDLALDYGLLGDVAAGERWMDEAAKRAREHAPLTLPAMQAFAGAVRDCRAGRPAEAARLLDERWAEYEAALTGDVLRPLRVVRAFAIAAAGPRDAGMAEVALMQLRPTFPQELSFLGVAWPEMAQFLMSHGLARA